jgi:DNA-binding response OmpR family regulator
MAIKNNKLVMVLEDDTDLAEGIELSLQSDELNFVICETIAEARKALEHYSFDLLIFDINLPDGKTENTNSDCFTNCKRHGNGYS